MYPDQFMHAGYAVQPTGLFSDVFSEVRTVPGTVLIVLATTLYSCYGGSGLGGFRGTGLAWIIALSVAFLSLLRPGLRVVTPMLIWLPWLAVVLGNCGMARERHEFQRSAMFICPMIVGLAVARCRLGSRQLQVFLGLCKIAGVLLWLPVVFAIVFRMGPFGWRAHICGLVMTTALLAALFAVETVIAGSKSILWWIAMAAIPILCVTRAGIAVSMVVLPFTAAPLKWGWRLGLICCGGGLLLGIFMLPRVQQKMFFSGHGELADLTWDNPDLATSGRKAMWEAMLVDIAKKPWFGYGPGADYAWMESYYPGLQHPHNDWLRLIYNYGIVGCAAFLVSAGIQIYHLFRLAGRAVSAEVRILAYTGISSMLALFLFMVTDNIINYPNFFGNLQFTIIGLVYAACGTASLGSGHVLARRGYGHPGTLLT